MLLLLTLIGVTGMQVASLEERMAGNAKDINLAFQAAETTLRGAEKRLSATGVLAFNNTNGLYAYVPGVERWKEDIWSSDPSNTKSIRFPLTGGGVSGHEPRYIIEELPGDASLDPGTPIDNYYRVTTQANGPTDASVVVLQVVYKR